MRILLVEPDASVAESICLMLRSESFNVTVTDCGLEAVDLGKIYDYDLICTEWNLPDLSGLDVIKQLRTTKVRTSIIVLSSHDRHTVLALGVGADDYMTKPFHKDELVARIHAIVRRSKGYAQSVIDTGPLSLNMSTKTVTVSGKLVNLTGKEYGMLELLSLRKGNTIAKESFMSHLYGGRDEPEMKIIDVFVCKLRRKLANAFEQAGLQALDGHGIVETVHSRGYVMREPHEPIASCPSLAPELKDLANGTGVDFIPLRFVERAGAA